MITNKKSYQAPKLVDWGSVVELTQVGQTNPGGDVRFGSVNPRGHDKNTA